jgi:CheY-like chemotaxis protein
MPAKHEQSIGSRSRPVLVVDDSAACRQLVATILQAAGFQCYEAANGQQALDCLQWSQAGLVITDLDMPVMDGFALIAALQSLPATQDRPAIVVCSAMLDDPDVFGRPEIAGVASLIFKPVTPLNLLRTVESVLQAGQPVGPGRRSAGRA